MFDADSSLKEQLPRLARMALGHVEKEYPNHIMLVMNEPMHHISPKSLHPIFYGSFDWHSCVHSYWMLTRLLRHDINDETVDAIRALLQRAITPETVAGEVAYFKQPGRASFERPYGWAWLLMLAQELRTSTDHTARTAGEYLSPLEVLIRENFIEFWPKQAYPIRTGTHANSAFATVLALKYAHAIAAHFPEEQHQISLLSEQLKTSAKHWFMDDVNCQAWEPGGDEFLSSTLMEAVCMKQVLSSIEFNHWFDAFLPKLSSQQPKTLFTPATVTDRTDGKLAHLDGLNISRAWCWFSLAQEWSEDDARKEKVLQTAEEHLSSALEHIDKDYMGSHWLGSFVLLALESSV